MARLAKPQQGRWSICFATSLAASLGVLLLLLARAQPGQRGYVSTVLSSSFLGAGRSATTSYLQHMQAEVGRYGQFQLDATMPGRPASDPFISGDTFRAMATWIMDETQQGITNPEDVKDGDIVFLKSENFDHFFSSVHPKIKARYIALSHNSDNPMPVAHRTALDDAQLVLWLGQNCECEPPHPKLRPVPIGLENRWHKPQEAFEHLKRRALRLNGAEQRTTLLYVNVRTHSNADRARLIEQMKRLPFARVVGDDEKRSFEAYIDDVASSVFVLSPFGNGIDCHRTWEALVLGAIPIVQRSSISRQLFEGHPVMVVEDLSQVSKASLDAFLASLKQKNVARPYVWAQWWLEELQRLQAAVRNSTTIVPA